jgi:hypothetical protein
VLLLLRGAAADAPVAAVSLLLLSLLLVLHMPLLCLCC